MAFDQGNLLSAVAGLVTALTGIWAIRAKLWSDGQAIQGDRVTKLEEKVDRLYQELDAERQRVRESDALRMRAETLTHRFRLGLITAVNQLEELYAWIRDGARPPAPGEKHLDDLRSLIDSE